MFNEEVFKHNNKSINVSIFHCFLTQTREQVTMQRQKSGRVFILGSAVGPNVNEIEVEGVIGVIVLAVAERDLIVKFVVVDKTERFEVRVEAGHNGQGGVKHVFNHIPDGDVIG